MKTFVFIQGTTGLQGQIWHTAQVSGEGKERIQPVFRRVLTADEENLTLDQLIAKYATQAENIQR